MENLELNKIYNENCLATMAKMPEGFVDLIVTSPPYDDLRKYNGYSFDFETIAPELFRILKTGGVLVWVVGDQTIDGSETLTSFRQAIHFRQIGFNLHDTMIYTTDKPPLNHNRYEQAFEYMFIFSKGKPKTFNPIMEKTIYAGVANNSNQREKDGRLRPFNNNEDRKVKEEKIKQNVWKYASGYLQTTKDKLAFTHPAMFPEKLAEDHIFSWSNKNDLIYDPFGGSGTVAKAAHLLQRNWILSEISPEYCQLAEARIAPYLQKQFLF